MIKIFSIFLLATNQLQYLIAFEILIFKVFKMDLRNGRAWENLEDTVGGAAIRSLVRFEFS